MSNVATITSHPRFSPAEYVTTERLMRLWYIRSANTVTNYIARGMPVERRGRENLFDLAACEEWRRKEFAKRGSK